MKAADSLSAWGPNKKMAEQKAALLALEELGVFDPGEGDEPLSRITQETPDNEDDSEI